jgi:hypothetical protein
MILDEGRFRTWLKQADLPVDVLDTINHYLDDFEYVEPEKPKPPVKESMKMSARYEAKGNSYAAKDILKVHGFRWNPDGKIWSRQDGIFDYNGDSAEIAVQKARAKIKEAGIDCDIVYLGGDAVPT